MNYVKYFQKKLHRKITNCNNHNVSFKFHSESMVNEFILNVSVSTHYSSFQIRECNCNEIKYLP